MQLPQMKRVELTPEQRAHWRQTEALFGFSCPGFIHLFRKLLVNQERDPSDPIALFTDRVPMAATDGSNIMLNPGPFFKLAPAKRTFVLAHEVVHCVFNDPAMVRMHSQRGEIHYPDGLTLPYINDLYQWAMDYRINDMLVKTKVGELLTAADGYAVLRDEKIGTMDDSAVDIYRKLFKKHVKQGKAEAGGNGGQQGFDQVMSPGTSQGKHPEDGTLKRDEGQWKQELITAQTLERAKRLGNISGSLQRFFDGFLKPQVPWTDHIEGFFARRLGSGGYNWRRADRRLIVRDIYAPGRSGFGVNWVCVWGDTSGSIGQAELNTYFSELASLIEQLRPRRVTVFWADSEIKYTDDIYDAEDLEGVRARGVGGGGGTSCVPVFKAIEQMSTYDVPDAFVGLTDGYAAFPSYSPSYPCVWAVTSDTAIPFGEVVRIKVE